MGVVLNFKLEAFSNQLTLKYRINVKIDKF